jgi:putative transposase
MVRFKRNRRTSSKYIYYVLEYTFQAISSKNISKTVYYLYQKKAFSIWNWIQRYKPKRIFQKRRKVSEFIVDETFIKPGNEYMYDYGCY